MKAKRFIIIIALLISVNFVKSQNVGIATTDPQANLHVNGSFIAGTNGTSINAIIRDTVNLGPTITIGPGTTLGYNLTVNNAVVGGTAYASCSLQYPLVLSSCFVSSANTVMVRLTNVGTSTAFHPGINLYITVIQ